MVMKNGKVTQVSETNIGIYVWQLPNGEFLADGDANVLSINSMRGDIQRMAAISNEARNLGFEGTPVFIEGRRKISDEEFQEQIYRLATGRVPDEYDIGNLKDEMRRSN
jgi:hypothetical protein